MIFLTSIKIATKKITTPENAVVMLAVSLVRSLLTSRSSKKLAKTKTNAPTTCKKPIFKANKNALL